MALIEGVGDEVTACVVALVLLVLLTLAWLSTGVVDRPLVGIIIFDGQTLQHFLSRFRHVGQGGGTQHLPGSDVSQNEAAGSDDFTQTQAASASPDVPNVTAPGAASAGVTSVAETLVADGSGSLQSTPGSEGFVHVEDFASVAPEGTDTPLEGEMSEDSAGAKGLQPRRLAPAGTDVLREGEMGEDSARVEGLRHRHLPPAGMDTLQEGEMGEDSAGVEGLQHKHLAPAGMDTLQEGEMGEDSAGVEGLRRRRLAFYNQTSPNTGDLGGDNTRQEEAPSGADSSQGTETDKKAATDSGSSASSGLGTEDFVPLEGHIRIRLKYLDERQRWVQARPEETVAQFKRAHFASELTNNMVVRFIFNGRELSQDWQSLASYNVANESVIHCLFSQVAPAEAEVAPTGGLAVDMGRLMLPLFGLMLGLIWYSRFTYKQYFNTMSTLTLVAISFLFIVALLASFRAPETQEAEAD